MPILTILLTAALIQPAAGAPAAEAAPPGVRIQTAASHPIQMVHWIDNLAGSSVGKTRAIYRRYWEERFGPLDDGDKGALEAFARARRAPVEIPAAVENDSGCLPVEEEALSWHQTFLALAMRSGTLAEFQDRLEPYLGAEELAAVTAALDRFGPRLRRALKDLDHAARFERRFERFFGESGLAAYLDEVARFLGVDPAAVPPMRIAFVPLPANGPTHAEADGDDLLVEIRPLDSPRDQIQVVAHEAAHFLMRRMGAGRIDRLASQIHAEGDAGSLIWRYMWEGIPTALGQGLAESRLAPEIFSPRRSWYHIPAVDAFAKMAFPILSEEIAAARSIEDGAMRRIAAVVGRSRLMTGARPAEMLMTAFFASGEGLADELESLREKMGLGRPAGSRAFALSDPEGPALLSRYSCLGGVVMVSIDELEKATSLDGLPGLPPDAMSQARARAEKGWGTIDTRRRPGGGIVYYLVAPDRGSARMVAESFARLRGVPASPVVVTGAAAGAP